MKRFTCSVGPTDYAGRGPPPRLRVVCVATKAVRASTCVHNNKKRNSTERSLHTWGKQHEPCAGVKPLCKPAPMCSCISAVTRHDPPEGTSTKPCEGVLLQAHCHSATPSVEFWELGTSTHFLAAVEVRMA